MDVTSPTQTNATQTSPTPAAAPGKDKPAISSDFQTFLTMLTTQLEYQDPLNPVESTDFAVQLATFSGVEQQVQTNELLTTLTEKLGASGIAQLAGWVGMQARAPAAGAYDGTPLTLYPATDSTADSARLVVRNTLGTVVETRDIAVGAAPINWMGLDAGGNELPDGLYTFQVESYKAGGLLGTRQAEVYATITEARVENGETVLVLQGGATIKSSAVTALRAAE